MTGRVVQVLHGPYSGKYGVVIDYNCVANSVKIRLSKMSRQTEKEVHVEVCANDVKAID